MKGIVFWRVTSVVEVVVYGHVDVHIVHSDLYGRRLSQTLFLCTTTHIDLRTPFSSGCSRSRTSAVSRVLERTSLRTRVYEMWSSCAYGVRSACRRRSHCTQRLDRRSVCEDCHFFCANESDIEAFPQSSIGLPIAELLWSLNTSFSSHR